MLDVCLSGQKILVSGYFNDEFIASARKPGLDGDFEREKKLWIFPFDNWASLKDLLNSTYLWDGTVGKQVALSVNLDHVGVDGKRLLCGPCEVLVKNYRDSAPMLGVGCSVAQGKLLSRGGSKANPQITFEPGTVIKIRHFPLPAARRLIEINPRAYSIVEERGESLPDRLLPLVEQLRSLSEQDLQQVINSIGINKQY